MPEFARINVVNSRFVFELSNRIVSLGTRWAQVAGNHAGASALTDLATILASSVGGNLRQIMSEDCEFHGVSCFSEEPREYISGKSNAVLAAGGVVGQSVPSNHAALLRLRSSSVPTRIFGRIYIPGIPEDYAAGQVLDRSAALAAFAAVAISFQSDIVTAGNLYTFSPCFKTISPAVGASQLAPKYFSTDSTVWSILIAQMRKRQRRSLGIEAAG